MKSVQRYSRILRLSTSTSNQNEVSQNPKTVCVFFTDHLVWKRSLLYFTVFVFGKATLQYRSLLLPIQSEKFKLCKCIAESKGAGLCSLVHGNRGSRWGMTWNWWVGVAIRGSGWNSALRQQIAYSTLAFAYGFARSCISRKLSYPQDKTRLSVTYLLCRDKSGVNSFSRLDAIR